MSQTNYQAFIRKNIKNPMNETVVKTRNQGDFKTLNDLVNATNQKHIQTKFEKKFLKHPQNRDTILYASTK